MKNAIQLSLHWILLHRQPLKPQLPEESVAPVQLVEVVAERVEIKAQPQGWIRTIQRSPIWSLQQHRLAAVAEAAAVAVVELVAMLHLPLPLIPSRR